MKKLIFVLLTTGLLLGMAYANNIPASASLKPLESPQGYRMPQTRNSPEYSFSKLPTYIMTSYYDYMIGSYNGLPLRVIPSSAGGGYFMTYHGRRHATSTRRVFYTYLDANANLVHNNEITYINNNEGYPSMSVDYVSGKPMYAWHANADTDAELEVQFVTDAFLAGFSGLWNDVQVAIDNPMEVTHPNGTVTNHSEFIWPTVHIGPSPIAGKRRAYVVGRNAETMTYGPSENPYIAYADFDADDIEGSFPLIWSYTSIPEMNQWNIDDQWRRPFHAVTADNAGNLYYAGYHFATEADGNTTIDEESIDIFICPNYGAGTWTRLSFWDKLPTWNPPTGPYNPTGYFEDSYTGLPLEDHQLFYKIANSSHINASVDQLGRIHVLCCFALSTSTGHYYPNLQYVKEFVFDPFTQEVTINEIYPQKPADDEFNEYFTPWDIEAPYGEVDEFYHDASQSFPLMVSDFPFPHWDKNAHDETMFFHYNNFKISDANEEGMMVAVWQNSHRARNYNEFEDDDYAAFTNTPEIWISVSANNGDNWSEPIILNNVETPEFANIKPMWVYPADKVIYAGMQGVNKVGKVGFMFYDDFTWGSSALTPPYHMNQDGGNVMFMELEIVFPLVGNLGSLSGTVTVDDIPLAGATIAVQGTAITTTSATDGTYYLPYIYLGNQTVSAAKHGYTTVSHIVNIVEDENTIQNFALSALPQVTVTGRIIGSDQPGVGLSGATISLSGYELYNATTNAEGQFTFPNVYANHTYQYVAEATGYQTATGQAVVDSTSLDLGDIIIIEIAFPPHGVEANVNEDFTEVNVTWQTPDPTASNRLRSSIQEENPLLELSQSNDQYNTRVMMGYMVYRLYAGEETNEAAWIQLTPTNINITNYTDIAWTPLPPGVYKYAVKAIYTDNVMSPPAFSGELHKDMMGRITGTVTDFGTGSPLVGATVTAGEYTDITDDQGIYSILAYTGSYNVICSKDGYQPAIQNDIMVFVLETTFQDFVLSEITLPPVAVQAEEAGHNVNLSWMAPGSYEGEWMHYDSGDNHTSIGTNTSVQFDVAIRFPASDLADFTGMSLQAIKAWPAQEGTYRVRAWTGGNATAPGTQVVNQIFTPEIDAYNIVLLNEPVLITGAEELWFGYNCDVNSGFPAGCDSGPAIDGFGNMMYFEGEWATLLDLAPSLNYNWNIQGYIGYSAPTEAPRIAPISLKSAYPGQYENRERALTGYQIWRLLQGQEDDENTWTLLTTDPIGSTTYQDTQWTTLDDATYKWAVKAIYTGDAVSPATISNAIARITQIGTIAGIVRNQQNTPIGGATITCGSSTTITNNSGAYSLQANAGIHCVIARHPNYASVIHENITVMANQTTTVNFILPPLQVVFEDSFESYDNFSIQFAPWILVDVDQSNTYGITNTTWENAYTPQSFIIFVPSATTPPFAEADPHTGNKLAACFASTTMPNNDWLITPQILGADQLTFWARSFTVQYGVERFKVGVSTTGTNPEDFTIISGGSYVSAPDEWTEYSYDLSSYIDTHVFIGVNCVSNDAFFFMVDDFEISGVTDADDNNIPALGTALGANYPNPFNPQTTITYSLQDASPVTIEIYNIKGQLVKTLVNENKASGNYSVIWNGEDAQGRIVSSGVYYYKMHAGKYSSTRKMILLK